MLNERFAGGLLCSQVLNLLTSYVDSELPPEALMQVQDHVAVCQNCARFGASFHLLVRCTASAHASLTENSASLHRILCSVERRLDQALDQTQD